MQRNKTWINNSATENLSTNTCPKIKFQPKIAVTSKIFLQILVWTLCYSLKLQSHWEFNSVNIMRLRNFRFIHLLLFGARVGQEERRNVEICCHPFKTSKQKVQPKKKRGINKKNTATTVNWNNNPFISKGQEFWGVHRIDQGVLIADKFAWIMLSCCGKYNSIKLHHMSGRPRKQRAHQFRIMVSLVALSPQVLLRFNFFTSLTFLPVSNIRSGLWDLLRTAQGKQEKRALQAAAAKKL